MIKPVALAILLFPVAATAQNTTCSATKASYDALKAGMSIAQAQAVIGCAGEELSSSEMAGFTTVMLAWEGKGGFGANMNAMFQNDELVNKAQMGLR